MSLVDLHHGFRDKEQLQSAQGVVIQRLADDPDEAFRIVFTTAGDRPAAIVCWVRV